LREELGKNKREQMHLSCRVVAGDRVGDAEHRAIEETLQHAFDGWPHLDLQVTSSAHLRWKLEGPRGLHSQVVLVEADSKIVGVTITLDLRFQIKGRRCRARLGTDGAVHPDFRGQGVDTLRKAYQIKHVEPLYDLSLGYTRHPAAVHGERKHGSEQPGNPIRVLFKPIHLGRAAAEIGRRKTSRMPAPLWAAAIFAGRLVHRMRYRAYPPQAMTWSLSTLSRFDARIEPFFEEASRPFDFIQVRSTDYLNWRYCDPRAGRFTVRAAEERGRILGYAVAHMAGERGSILDLLALPDRVDVARSLVEDALGALEEAGVSAVDCWCVAEHPYSEIFRRCGFIDTRRRSNFYYRPTGRRTVDLRFLRDPGARIHLTQGDSDVV
jgi:GNAT superfamily N-acetyltransferase